MPKPSLMQTILRQPTTTYSDRPSSYRESTTSSRRGSSSIRSESHYSDASSIRSGVGSTGYNADLGAGPPLSGPGPGGWEWSVFGARKGLTGGPASLRASSEVARAATKVTSTQSEAGAGDDGRSLRSARSFGSLRSGRESVKSGRSELSTRNSQLGRDSSSLFEGASGRLRKVSGGTSRSYKDLATTTAAPAAVPASTHSLTPMDRIRKSHSMPSRRYHTPLPPAAPVSGYFNATYLQSSSTSSLSRSLSPSPSLDLDIGSASGSVMPKKKKKKRRTPIETNAGGPSSAHSDETDLGPTPSLTSSISSAPSSAPATPVATVAPSFPVDKDKDTALRDLSPRAAIEGSRPLRPKHRAVEAQEPDEDDEVPVVIDHRLPSDRRDPRPLSVLMEDSESSETETERGGRRSARESDDDHDWAEKTVARVIDVEPIVSPALLPPKMSRPEASQISIGNNASKAVVVEHGQKLESGVIPEHTQSHLDRFAQGSPVLSLPSPIEAAAMKPPAHDPIALLSPSPDAPHITHVPLADTSAIAAPSELSTLPVVAVGKVYTMDEFFASLPLAAAPTLPTAVPSHPDESAPAPSPSLSAHKETIKNDFIPHSSLLEQVVATAPIEPEVKPLPAAVTRIATTPEPTPSEASSNPPSTDVSSAPTSTVPKTFSAEEKGKGRELEAADDLHRPVPFPAVDPGVPRIQLTRTDSDQKAAGVQGDVVITGEEQVARSTPSPSESKGKTSKRISSPPKPEPVLEVVASSSTKTRSKKSTSRKMSPGGMLTSENLAAAASAAAAKESSTAAQDAPRWLRNVRALEDAPQFQPLIMTPGVKARRAKSMSSRPPDSIYSAPAMSTIGSFKRGPPSIMESMPDDSVVHRRHRRPLPAPLPVDARSATPQTEPAIVRRKKKRSSVVASTFTPSTDSASACASQSVSRAPSPLPYSQPTPRPVHHSSLPRESHEYPPSVKWSGPEQFGMTYAQSDIGPRHSVAQSVASDISHHSSDMGYSVVSAPIRAYNSAHTPKRVSIGATTLLASSGTMNALSISANATVNRAGGFSLFKRAPAPVPTHPFDPLHDLAFGMLQPPPKKLRSDEVLVEILAVALDKWDYERAAEMVNKSEGFGWVPGRSFCARVVECGIDVSRLKKGDFVYGLNELRKSGALAELLTINRDLLTLAPEAPLSVEQIAALPLGIDAVRVMHALCDDLPRGSKILVLDAHEGVGNLCMQLAYHFRKANDLWLVAQCPRNSNAAEYCRSTGAADVIADEPLAALNSIHESSFDVVIDTIGGRRLYDASRRILHSEGSFITTVGDSLALPDASTQWKTGIRSLKRSFFKKDKKSISYWAVNLDYRDNAREILEQLKAAVELSKVRPTVTRIVPFAEAATAFDSDSGSGTVVKVMEL